MEVVGKGKSRKKSYFVDHSASIETGMVQKTPPQTPQKGQVPTDDTPESRKNN
jgi:hypothetical protein